ncbi:MAG: creatininase family protein [Nitrospirae bacterium]|nr:creatininase family protein [Nitrospirota bacterium]
MELSRTKDLRSIAYLPVGCIEQHGPFLPLETDSLIAQEISRAITAGLKDRYYGYVFPSLHYTPSQANANYCGTASVPDGSFRAYAQEVCSAIMQSPFDALVLIAGHAGTESSLREIAFWLVNGQYCSGEQKVRPVFVVSILEAAALIEEKFGQKSGRHADWREFLLLYHILGRGYFTGEKLQKMKAFHADNTFKISTSRIHGVPMEYRSTEGVLGEPLPSFSDEYEETSSVLWEFLIANLTQKVAGELDGFWTGPFAS